MQCEWTSRYGRERRVYCDIDSFYANTHREERDNHTIVLDIKYPARLIVPRSMGPVHEVVVKEGTNTLCKCGQLIWDLTTNIPHTSYDVALL